jgi:hypothetical protein
LVPDWSEQGIAQKGDTFRVERYDNVPVPYSNDMNGVPGRQGQLAPRLQQSRHILKPPGFSAEQPQTSPEHCKNQNDGEQLSNLFRHRRLAIPPPESP